MGEHIIHERREHDLECKARMKECEEGIKIWTLNALKDLKTDLKEYITTQICLATKGGKIWARFMWALVFLMLAGTLGGNLYGISVASDQQAIDTQQSADIAHNVQEINEIRKAHEKMTIIQEQMAEDIGEMKLLNQKALIILESLEKEKDGN